ncbi:MAG: hypothetical protein AAGK17_02165 [Pseudomonadota bacterium]
MRYSWGTCIAASLAACSQPDAISRDAEPFNGIDQSETIIVAGTEPFWSIKIVDDEAIYSAPENLDGTMFSVSRFAGNNGLGFSGELESEKLVLSVTPGDCNDGMSDEIYPYTATLVWGDETRFGCAETLVQESEM